MVALAKSYKPTEKEKYMNAKQQEYFRQKLIAWREELLAESQETIEHLKEETKPISPENAIGRVSRMDAINNKSVVEASLRQIIKKLSKLKIALSKIENKDFGKCMNCGRDIQEKRLLFLPQSDRCVRCAM